MGCCWFNNPRNQFLSTVVCPLVRSVRMCVCVCVGGGGGGLLHVITCGTGAWSIVFISANNKNCK